MEKLKFDATYDDIYTKCVELEKLYPSMGVLEVTYPGNYFNFFWDRELVAYLADRETLFIDDAENAIININAIIEKNKTLETPKLEATDWDSRFLKMAKGEINTWSKDPSTSVSATVFRGKHPIASAYNGFPAGIADTPERLNNRELKYKFTLHAEANAVAVCSKLGISTEGCTIAVTHPPCYNCASLLIQAGIVKVITQKPTEDFIGRWGESLKIAKEMFEEAEVEYLELDLDDN